MKYHSMNPEHVTGIRDIDTKYISLNVGARIKFEEAMSRRKDVHQNFGPL